MHYQEQGEAPVTWGQTCTADEVRLLLTTHLARNQRLEDTGRPRSCLCLWGVAGIGKTSLVKELASPELAVVDVPLAQFEEMGDLHGMPEIVAEIKDGRPTGRQVTRMAPPDWAPPEGSRGILLFDDFNRADLRIIRGIMQLLQDYRLRTWALPAGWSIVLTANPTGGDYLVQELDDAILTRMRHVTLKPDAKAWLKWALGQGLDQRGLDFVAAHPEVIELPGRRTNPRTLAEFFSCLPEWDNLGVHAREIEVEGMASLDTETVSSFLGFALAQPETTVNPDDIINRYTEIEDRVGKLLREADNTCRLDRLHALCEQLLRRIQAPGFVLTATQVHNVQWFLLADFMPADKVRQLMLELFDLANTSKCQAARQILQTQGQLLDLVCEMAGVER